MSWFGIMIGLGANFWFCFCLVVVFFLDSASSLGFGECDSYRYLVLLAG